MNDVIAAFAELGENYPGSTKKRRAVTGSAAPDSAEEDRWDSHPLMIEIDGVEHEFFQIGALAMALGRTSGTVRKWITNGVIPKARYRTSSPDAVRGSRRLWTRAQIEGITRIAREEGLMAHGPCYVSTTEFSARVFELFRVLKATEP